MLPIFIVKRGREEQRKLKFFEILSRQNLRAKDRNLDQDFFGETETSGELKNS